MPQYKYKAVSLSGVIMNGEYTASSKDAVITMLRQNDYYPVEVVLVAADVDRVTKKKIKIKPLAAACQQISSMLRAGVPILKTFEIIKDQTENKNLKMVFGDVYTKIQKGVSLTDAFSAYSENFPVIFINMLEAGEASGTLDLCIERAGITFARSAKLTGKLRAAMIYPILLLVLMIIIVIGLLVFVMPTFVTLFEQNNAELPFLTQLLVDMSNFVQTRWYIIIFVVAVFLICWFLFLNSDKGRTAFDKFKLHIPLVKKLILKVYAARYSRTLASLSSAGVSLPNALDVTARSIDNRYIEKRLYDVMDAVNKGEQLSDHLERMGIMPVMLVYLTRLGEESGTLDSLLIQAADFYDEESEAALQTMTALAEPIMIIVMALLLLPVILAIILPVFGMYSIVG